MSKYLDQKSPRLAGSEKEFAGHTMAIKSPLKAAAVVASIALLLLSFAAIDSTRKGYLVWFARIPSAAISINGKPAKGWLHGTRDGQTMFFTRADSDKPVTYDLIFTSGEKNFVVACGTWVAPQLPFIAVGDVNPPCFFVGGHGGRNLNKGERFVSFVTDDGARLEADW